MWSSQSSTVAHSSSPFNLAVWTWPWSAPARAPTASHLLSLALSLSFSPHDWACEPRPSLSTLAPQHSFLLPPNSHMGLSLRYLASPPQLLLCLFLLSSHSGLFFESQGPVKAALMTRSSSAPPSLPPPLYVSYTRSKWACFLVNGSICLVA